MVATVLVGCEPKDTTKTLFKYDTYAYSVSFGEVTKPEGLVAVEVTYLDVNGELKTEAVTGSWLYTVPAKKGFQMKMTSKIVLTPGANRPTSGSVVKYEIATGIVGVKDGKPSGYESLAYHRASLNMPDAYTFFLAEIDNPTVNKADYVIKPILEAGM